VTIPKIQKVEFGNIVINGRVYSEDNIIIFWDDVQTIEKSHKITKSVFEKVLLREPEIVIIGIGFNNLVKVSDEVKEIADRNKIELLVLDTKSAIKEFKKIVHTGKRVVAIIHPTC